MYEKEINLSKLIPWCASRCRTISRGLFFFFADATMANCPFEGVVRAKGRTIESVIRFNPWRPIDSENKARIARRIGLRRAPRKSPCNSDCRLGAGLCFPILKGEETPARWRHCGGIVPAIMRVQRYPGIRGSDRVRVANPWRIYFGDVYPIIQHIRKIASWSARLRWSQKRSSFFFTENCTHHYETSD